ETKPRLTWRVHDFISDCPVDVEATFADSSLAVTDLDKNGQAEVWLVYTKACRGDVSPSNMKIIMYEQDKKYAMRGTTRVSDGENSFTGGEYTLDEAFKKGPAAFRNFGEALWKKHRMESWD
ncbi:MAG TPA: hypothetical protein VFR58_17210, partial [Flavisolibacter sp.]|nr:hypothetical protein [Flavisolibacter sp.]